MLICVKLLNNYICSLRKVLEHMPGIARLWDYYTDWLQRANKWNPQRITVIPQRRPGNVCQLSPSACTAVLEQQCWVGPICTTARGHTGCPSSSRPCPAQAHTPTRQGLPAHWVKQLLHQLPACVLFIAIQMILFQHCLSYLLPTSVHGDDFDLVWLLTLLLKRRVKNKLNSLADELVTASHRDCSDIRSDK